MSTHVSLSEITYIGSGVGLYDIIRSAEMKATGADLEVIGCTFDPRSNSYALMDRGTSEVALDIMAAIRQIMLRHEAELVIKADEETRQRRQRQQERQEAADNEQRRAERRKAEARQLALNNANDQQSSTQRNTQTSSDRPTQTSMPEWISDTSLSADEKRRRWNEFQTQQRRDQSPRKSGVSFTDESAREFVGSEAGD